MDKIHTIIFVLLFFPFWMCGQMTAVLDNQHNTTTTIEALTETAATGLKQFFETPFIESISKVQTFFREASQLVSKIVQNLRMTRQLIETEKEIYELFTRSMTQIEESEDFAEKWKYRWILLQLFNESGRIFEVFDIATQENMGVIDDKGRILLIKNALKQAKSVKASMRATVRRANRAWYKLKTKQKEFETFANLFKEK
ncbi:MAG: hypothetical protein AAGJ18_05100 [Bacteroidota bacterium]